MRTATLSQVAEINPRGPRSGSLPPDELLDFVPMASVSETGQISVDVQRPYKEVAKGFTAFRNNDVLVAKITPCFENNKIALAKIKTAYAFGSTEFHVIRSCPDEIDPKYVTYFLRQDSIRQAGKRQMAGSAGQQRIPKSFLEDIEIPLPTLDEQRRIAAILDQADELRRLRQTAIANLDVLVQSIFYDMFGSPIGNEKKWDVKNLERLAIQITSGSTPVGGKKIYKDNGTIFLRSQNVWRRSIDLSDVAYIDKSTHNKMKKTSLKHGDILITKTGRINTENSSLGRSSIFRGEDDSANINGHVYLIRPKPEVLGDFILYVITTQEYRDYIRSVCVGGIDKRQINKEHLEEFPIIYPPIKDQQDFLNYASLIETQKSGAHEQLEACESLFFSLQQRAFRGEL